MDAPAPNYRGRFLRSPHHLGLACLTLGLGIASASPFGFMLGAAAYALGWIHMPDMPFFRRWVDGESDSRRRADEAAQVAEFRRRRDLLLDALSPQRRELYESLADVCRDIERASAENPLSPGGSEPDPRLRKLDELMWTYLRLLGIEESLERFVETERGEDVPGLLRRAEEDIRRVAADVQRLQTAGDGPEYDAKKRLFSSMGERVEVLKKRVDRCRQADQNLELVAAERDRLVQQVKLIRADAVATRNAEALTSRIDATVEHLDQTNKWLSELDEFKDMVGDLPASQSRIGFEASRASPPDVAKPATSIPPALESEEQMRARRRRHLRHEEQ
jgi:hypothetical protein